MANDNPWRDRIKSRFKDREFTDDEELGAAGADLLDELSAETEKGRTANKHLLDVFMAEPAVADFVADIMSGSPVEVALAKNFDLENMAPQEGEDNYSQWSEQKAMRAEKAENARKFDEELSTNKVESSKAFDSFIAEKGYTEEQADNLLNTIDGFLSDIHRGKVTREFLDAMDRSNNYQNDIDATRQAAIVEGKNATIASQKITKPTGDGLPEVTGTATVVAPKREPNMLERAAARSRERQRF